MTIADGEIVRDAYAYDHPEIFWFYDDFTLMVYPSTGMTSKFSYSPVISGDQISSMQNEISKKVKTINIDKEKPDHDILRKLHDWLCDNIVYTSDTPHEGDMYGAIVEGKCVCQGYTMAYTYLCHLYGFKCVGITGFTYSSSTVGHAWNLVYGEGNWYFVDVTWDDDERYGGRSTYFMVGSETKIHGRIFATEDHMADSLYGITPSTSKYLSPENKWTSAIILVAIAAGVFIYIFYRIRSNKRSQQQILVSDIVPDGGEFTGMKCIYCGNNIDRTVAFCPYCGGPYEIKNEENKD